MRFLIYAKYGVGTGFSNQQTVHFNIAQPGQTLLYNGTEYLVYNSESTDPIQALVSPQLKIELNKAGALDFTILPTHPLYDFFRRMKTYVRVMIDNDEVFRGRVLSVESETYTERKIECEGDLAYLIDSYQEPDQTESKTTNADLTTDNEAQRAMVAQSQRANMPSESITAARASSIGVLVTSGTVLYHFDQLLAKHCVQVDSDKHITTGNVTVSAADKTVDFTATNYRNTKSAIDEDLTKYYGGFLKTRRSGTSVYLDWLETPGSASSQRITLGVNLIELQQKAAADDIFTRLIPIGENNLTIADANNGVKYIQNDAAYNLYGAIYRTENFSGVTTASKLKTKATRWMNNYCKDNPITITVKAVDLRLIDTTVDRIQLGSQVNIVNTFDGSTVGTGVYVTSIEYDIQNPENNSYEIGDPYEVLSIRTKDTKQAAETATSAAATTAHSASGGVSGLTAAVNRHAQNIIDIADKTYTLQADELNITARVITIEADLLEIHTEALTIESHYVQLTADYAVIGNIIMGGDGDYEMYLVGDTMLSGGLTVGGTLSAPRIECNVESANGGIFYDDTNLGNAVVSFGTVTSNSSTGVVSIPYTKANGITGTINFNMADTAWYKDYHMVWSVSLDAIPGTQTQSGNTVSVKYSAKAKNKQGETLQELQASRSVTFTPTLKTETFSSNGTYNVPSGYDGYGTITVDVPTGSTSHGPLTASYISSGFSPYAGGFNISIDGAKTNHKINIYCNGEYVDHLDITIA